MHLCMFCSLFGVVVSQNCPVEEGSVAVWVAKCLAPFFVPVVVPTLCAITLLIRKIQVMIVWKTMIRQMWRESDLDREGGEGREINT